MPKTSRKELTEAQIGAVLALFHAGLSQRKIHSQLGIPRSTIQYTINRFKNQEEGPYLTNSRPGRPPILNEREKRHLIRYVNSNPFENLNHSQHLQNQAISSIAIPPANISMRMKSMPSNQFASPISARNIRQID